jgi:hypothetical protein
MSRTVLEFVRDGGSPSTSEVRTGQAASTMPLKKRTAGRRLVGIPDMYATAFEALLILLLIVANGILALSELAVVSARKTRLQHWAARGGARAQVALELARAPDRLLSTVQMGITLVGVLAGAFGGATIAGDLAGYLEKVPVLAPYHDAVSLTVVALAIAYLSLVLGELVPKRIALSSPERVASTIAPPVRALSILVPQPFASSALRQSRSSAFWASVPRRSRRSARRRSAP